MYLLGIDGGQTVTRACLYHHGEGKYFFTSGPSIDHMLTSNGQIQSKQGIQHAVKQLIQQSPLPVDCVEMAYISISGVHKEHEVLIKSWVLECIKVNQFMIEGDVKANLAGASGGCNDGVLVISGGGSIAYYPNDKKEYTAGGYGHILGDEGSAYWIGIQAIKAGIRHLDHRGPKTILTEKVLEVLKETSFWGIKKKLHGGMILRSDIAKLSFFVDQAANNGDIVSQSILKSAGRELGELVLSVLQMCEQDQSLPQKVYPTGGVFQSKNWVLQSTKERIEKEYPFVQILQPLYLPIIGALLLASQAIKINLKLTSIFNERSFL